MVGWLREVRGLPKIFLFSDMKRRRDGIGELAAHQNIYNLKYEEEFIVVVVHDLS